MNRLLNCVMNAGLMAAFALSATAADLPEGRFGRALDAKQGFVKLPGDLAFAAMPITCECWVKLEGKDRYNIIVANEPKSSSSHWELFSMAGSGFLCAYLPGRTPDHARTKFYVTDGKWHYIGMILEKERVQLFVDAERQTDLPLSTPVLPPPAPTLLAIGALVDGGITCNGLIDEVRISRGVRPLNKLPDAGFVANADTIGLWNFNQLMDGRFKDASEFKRNAEPVALSKATPSTGLPGLGMSKAFEPLPPQEDVAPFRVVLKQVIDQLKLETVCEPAVRDAVLRAWLYDCKWIGKLEYPDHRKPWFNGGEDITVQVYDKQALVWDEDGGPAGTVLRRTGALLKCLEKQGGKKPLALFRKDLASLEKAYRNRTKTGDDMPLYLAACALRRNVAFANPLLDFNEMLCVARGTFAGSVRSNPNTADSQGGHFTTQYFGCNALPGGGLYVVKNFKDKPEIVNVIENSIVENGRLKGRKLDHGAFATPDLSFDGRTIAFAWTENNEHVWSYASESCFHIFRVNLDGSNLEQLTDGGYNDFDPCWLPDGRIAFISERRGGYIRCFSAALKVRNYTLFSVNSDGSNIHPLSYFETSEWNPTVNNQGQIIFTRWDYTDRENCMGTRMWICRPDGSDPRAPHGNYPHPYDTFTDHKPWKIVNGREVDSRLGAPLVEMGVRAVPKSPLYVFTAAPHHGEVFGSLCMLDLRQQDDGHMSQIKRITPDEPFPETENGGRHHYKYGTPWPLSEDFFICNAWESLVLVDRFGNKELLCELTALPCAQDQRLRMIDPIPLQSRSIPPVLPTSVAGRPATIAIMNVYDSDLPFPKGTKIKWLRVTQNILKANHTMGEPMIGYERENTPRIPLGIVPVESDGSAYFEAPVAKELIFQVLDENYMAVQSMRAVAFVHPGEQLTCQGCHEKTHKSPAAEKSPLALQRQPSKLSPEAGPIEPMSYNRQIKPIFENTCVKCHIEKKKGPQDMSYDALKEGFTFWHSGGMGQQNISAYMGVHGGSRTIPGRFGAHNSRIGQALLNENHAKAVSAEDRHKVILWLDSNSLRLGAYEREADQLRGELVWPSLDVDPQNLTGTADGGRPLKGNFWHENL